jgi:small subunit ribosomal protein S20
MPIKQAAIKALRQSKVRAERNAQVKDGIEYLRKMVRKSLEAKEVKKAEEFVKKSIQAIDKAVQKAVLKQNTASRIKSRLSKMVKGSAN